MLIDLAATAEVFHTPTGIAYADLTIDGHRETWPVRGPRVRAWLRRGYYEATRNVPSTQVPRLCRGGRSSLTFTAVFHRRDSPSVSYQHVMRGGSAMAIPQSRSWSCQPPCAMRKTSRARRSISTRRRPGHEAITAPMPGTAPAGGWMKPGTFALQPTSSLELTAVLKQVQRAKRSLRAIALCGSPGLAALNSFGTLKRRQLRPLAEAFASNARPRAMLWRRLHHYADSALKASPGVRFKFQRLRWSAARIHLFHRPTFR